MGREAFVQYDEIDLRDSIINFKTKREAQMEVVPEEEDEERDATYAPKANDKTKIIYPYPDVSQDLA